MKFDHRAFYAASLGVITLVGLPALAEPDDHGPFDLVHCCYPIDESGALSGVRALLPASEAPDALALARGAAASYETLIDNGPSSNRYDIVFVGDGYTEAELDVYAARINQIVAQVFAQQIFNRYGSYINVHRVDVVSNESGVSNDPNPPLIRDTALQMEFWCSGIERLLCVNVGLAWAYAAAAPDAQQVLAIANSTKYGGGGYLTQNTATAMSDNPWTIDLLLHEMGHSLARLADEYDGLGTYTGPEPSEPNASKLDESAMAAAGVKWAAWLGENFGAQWDGVVSTFEGSRYYNFGLYRPSVNSKMRSLGRPFNLVGAEAFIIEIYKVVDPIDDATAPGSNLPPTTTFFVQPLQPAGEPLSVQWHINNEPVPGATFNTFTPANHGLEPGTHQVSVVVTDPTPLVRNQAAREQHMTSRRDWTVLGVLGDLNGDGVVGSSDLAILLGSWGPCPPAPASCIADLTGSGSVGSADLAILLGLWG